MLEHYYKYKDYVNVLSKVKITQCIVSLIVSIIGPLLFAGIKPQICKLLIFIKYYLGF